MKKYLLTSVAAAGFFLLLAGVLLHPSVTEEILVPQAGVAELATLQAIPAVRSEPIIFPEVPLSVATEVQKKEIETPALAKGSQPVPQEATIEKTIGVESSHPARLIIPSIGLDAPIQNVGVNAKGEMDVPSGKTGNVGWYEYGTVPGAVGSAVLDAHVFAAFAKLKYVAPGDDIFVITHDGVRIHFVAKEAETYSIANVPLVDLFNKSDMARLNLITCAGSPTPDGSTYDHRLVVYATLIEDLSVAL